MEPDVRSRASASLRTLADGRDNRDRRRAPFGELTEHEIDHVYVYSPCSSAKRLHFHVNPDEAEELKWISLDSLKMWMRDNLEEFTVWFPKAFEIADILFTRQRTVIKGFSL